MITRLYKASWIIIFVLVVPVFLIGCFSYASSSANGKKVFKEFVANPIPKGVRVEKGMVTGFQGYYAYVIFIAEPDVFKELVMGYDLLPDCRRKETAQIGGRTEETYFDVRMGLGKPVAEAVASMPAAKCYSRANMDEKAEGVRGIFYMFYDEETHRAVFEGRF
jgi:hypothetical protein